jgi:hypothetical protein
MLSTKELTMSPAIPPSPAFPRFSDLPAELQVMVIDQALIEDMKQRKNKLIIRLHRYQTPKEKNSDKLMTSTPRPIVQLPKLPAVYHTSRLFRAEALRIRPIHQLLADNGLKTLLYRRGSMVVFDPAHDTVVLNLRNRSPSGLMLDALLDSLFALAKGICRSPSLKCVFRIGPKTHGRASGTNGQVVGSALRHPQFPSRATATLVREKGKLGIWQVAVDFKMR